MRRFTIAVRSALAGFLLATPASAVDIEWVRVGDPGNACDSYVHGCFGSVAYTYKISKYETTNAQYAEFLNAVAETDTYGLYNTAMASGWGGITRTGSSGSYTYSTIAGRADMPVSAVSWYDSLRFANWLHNGQPTGAQDSTTTEDGAYTFSGATSVGTRNAGATIFLTSHDEWVKAAYYDTAFNIYFDYPAGWDTQTVCALPGATANTANCYHAVGGPTDVGSYTGSASPNGTFDQGGNVWEWSEKIIGLERGIMGGSFVNLPAYQAAPGDSKDPPGDNAYIGFRVAMIPEPGTVLLVMTGLLGLAGYRRGRVSALPCG